MLRYVLVVVVVCVAAVPISARAASDTTICLNMGAALDAGVLIKGDDLAAASAACERAKQHVRSGTTLVKLVVAHGRIQEELRRRGGL